MERPIPSKWLSSTQPAHKKWPPGILPPILRIGAKCDLAHISQAPFTRARSRMTVVKHTPSIDWICTYACTQHLTLAYNELPVFKPQGHLVKKRPSAAQTVNPISHARSRLIKAQVLPRLSISGCVSEATWTTTPTAAQTVPPRLSCQNVIWKFSGSSSTRSLFVALGKDAHNKTEKLDGNKAHHAPATKKHTRATTCWHRSLYSRTCDIAMPINMYAIMYKYMKICALIHMSCIYKYRKRDAHIDICMST